MEIGTRRSSSLLSKEQFTKLLNAVFSKKGVIQKLHTYSEYIIEPRVVANVTVRHQRKKNDGCSQIGTQSSRMELIGKIIN